MTLAKAVKPDETKARKTNLRTEGRSGNETANAQKIETDCSSSMTTVGAPVEDVPD